MYGHLLLVPAEVSATYVVFQYWTDLKSAVIISIFIFITLAASVAFFGIYGEVKFWFASLKILLVIFLIIYGLVNDLGGIPGQERFGFRYWENSGPFVEHNL